MGLLCRLLSGQASCFRSSRLLSQSLRLRLLGIRLLLRGRGGGLGFIGFIVGSPVLLGVRPSTRLLRFGFSESSRLALVGGLGLCDASLFRRVRLGIVRGLGLLVQTSGDGILGVSFGLCRIGGGVHLLGLLCLLLGSVVGRLGLQLGLDSGCLGLTRGLSKACSLGLGSAVLALLLLALTLLLSAAAVIVVVVCLVGHWLAGGSGRVHLGLNLSGVSHYICSCFYSLFLPQRRRAGFTDDSNTTYGRVGSHSDSLPAARLPHFATISITPMQSPTQIR